jgi:hypothetical protein
MPATAVTSAIRSGSSRRWGANKAARRPGCHRARSTPTPAQRLHRGRKPGGRRGRTSTRSPAASRPRAVLDRAGRPPTARAGRSPARRQAPRRVRRRVLVPGAPLVGPPGRPPARNPRSRSAELDEPERRPVQHRRGEEQRHYQQTHDEQVGQHRGRPGRAPIASRRTTSTAAAARHSTTRRPDLHRRDGGGDARLVNEGEQRPGSPPSMTLTSWRPKPTP